MEVVESGIVAPSDETPKRRMWLSNFDLAFGVREHLPSIYHYRPNGNPNFFKVETLKASLSKALVHFYPLAGRLEVGPDGRIEINCTGEGVLFTVARCRYDVDAFGVFAPSEEMRQELVPTVESSQPPCMLFMVQVSYFQQLLALVLTDFMVFLLTLKIDEPNELGYFGNAILRTSEGAKVRDIVSNSLELAGEKIQQAVAKADDEFARSLIDYLEMGNDEREWFLTKGDLLVISWLGMPIYEVDFGWGKPEFMRRANMFCGGVGYIMDGPGGSGDVSVVMAMETENMEGFKKAFYQGFDLCSGFQA
ncbi:uncharacterized protein A4U43_C05F17860 [Asparagus officinalis]|uniref:Uncharacterized protein n=1 Tax=Asparagus officinalis TaxID=4686 RepID=A0A5P1ETG6_ASPOF|nr:uncharacterized protein A4U43_C05F17860 [Asparagus officinalis]